MAITDLITGGSHGFSAQLLLGLLTAHECRSVLCLVRAAEANGLHGVHEALIAAAHTSGVAIDVAMLARVQVIEGNFMAGDPALADALSRRADIAGCVFWHLADSGYDIENVSNPCSRLNEGETRQALALAVAIDASCFHRVAVDDAAESDELSLQSLASGDLHWRSFHCGALAGHSRTWRGLAGTAVHRLAMQFEQLRDAQTSPLRITLADAAVLPLLPFDLCVQQMLALAEEPNTIDQVLQLRSREPVNSRDVLNALAQSTGLVLEVVDPSEPSWTPDTHDVVLAQVIDDTLPGLRGSSIADSGLATRVAEVINASLESVPMSLGHESVLRWLHPLQQQQRWRDGASPEARLFAQQRGLGEQWNIGGWLLAQPMARFPNKIALQHDAQTLTYAELAQRMGCAARHLLEAGVHTGMRVALVSHDSLAHVSALLAVMHLGAIAVLINPLLSDHDIDASLVQAEATHVLTDIDALARFGQGVWQGPVTVLEALCIELEHASIPIAAPTHPLDAAFAVFTSGSSGRAKLIEHRHQDVLVATDRYASQLLDLRASDVLFSASRTSFAFGLQNLLIGLCKGARVILGPAKITAATIAGIIAKSQPTVMFAVPTLYQRLLDDPQLVDQVRCHVLRMCVAAGERLPGAVARRWHALTGVRVLDSLGSTEAFSTYLSNVVDVDVPGATGKLVPGFDALLRHADGRSCRNGERGTLWLRGPSLSIDMHDPVSVQRMERGWYCTHDVFWRDGDGYFYFCGRSDEMFKVAGQWVSPLDLEEVLLAHPQVREVAVTALGSDEDTLSTQAWVVSDSPSQTLAEELRELCKRELDARRYPHHVEFVAELPRTGTGKLLRAPLRQRAADPASFPLTTV